MKKRKLDASIISLLSIMTAIISVFTIMIRIPSPSKGYISLADVAIYFSSLAFGPLIGGLSAGLGTGLADILGGYAIPWAPLSFLIHGLQGLIAGKFAQSENKLLLLMGWILSGFVMVTGYYLSARMIYGKGMAFLGIAGNILQVSVGGAGAYFLYNAVKKSFPILKNLTKTSRWEEE